MFVALRDLRFARGRFVLIGSVVALISLLIGFVSGLTGGLATQNISAVLGISAERLVFSAPNGASPSFSDSAITAEQEASWKATDGVTAVQPIGISQTRAESAHARAAVAIFGVAPASAPLTPSTDGMVVLSSPAAAALGAAVDETITIAGMSFQVESIGGDDWYSHTPVVTTTLHDWQTYAAATGTPQAYATVLAVSGSPDWVEADAATATSSQTIIGSLMALSAFRSEIGSLLLMVGMLFGISGLIIGVFFTVWTMQRKGDIAVLKALGASTASLVRDALGQALIVLLLGIGVGMGLVAAIGSVIGGSLPFLLSPLTTVVPACLMIALGLAGAAFALRSVTSADPLTALGGNR